MAAITWRQLVGASPADATRPLAYAQQAFDNAFTRLGGVVAEREKLDEQNWATTKTNNTQAFLDQFFSRYKTPEELAAARASGEVDALRSQYGAQIDADKVRGAIDSRVQALQQQAQQAIAYQNMKLDQEQDPIKQQILGLAYQGKAKEAQALFAANPNLRHGADLMKAITEGERGKIRFDQDSQRYIWEGEKHTSDLARNAAAIRASDASAAASRAAAGTAAENRNLRFLEQLTKLQDKGVAVDNESVGSSKGFNAVLEAIKNGEPDATKRAELTAAASKIMRDPKNHDLTVTDLASLALSSSSGGWFSRRGGNLDQLVKDLRGSEEFRRSTAERGMVKDMYLQQAAALQSAIFPKGLPGRPANQPAVRGLPEDPADMPTAPRNPATTSVSNPFSDVSARDAGSGGKAAQTASVAELAEVEQEEMAAGLRTRYSKEVVGFLAQQAQEKKVQKRAEEAAFKQRLLQEALERSRAQAAAPGSLVEGAAARAEQLRRRQDSLAK